MARAGHWGVSSAIGPWLIRSMAPVDRWVPTKTKGRCTALGPCGSPTLLLTMAGATSGLEGTTPLGYLLDDDTQTDQNVKVLALSRRMEA